ncbi:hypothetical protein TSAR_010055 [Trichomalopsis sarcophagae]|uniref:UMA domain-containing protein n=1 Tax=Trichomalopsis sarcophagae TaxID=543379 RepID=A0A232F8K1_9HYME|nr:hypothetical protein TSAR_010055 [Trichomalopsis sarcophagae]
MSWFFGKKKHRDSPPDSPQEPAPSDDGEFIFIERRNQPEPNADDKPPSLYPSLSNITPYPSMPMAPFVKQGSQEGPTNYLTNIPFKFCKELERNMNEDLVIDQLRLNEIESFIKRINADNYNYEFSVERSVIAEMDSQNEE